MTIDERTWRLDKGWRAREVRTWREEEDGSETTKAKQWEVCGRQTLRPHNKDKHDDSPFGAGIAGGGAPACPEGRREVGKEMNEPNTNKPKEVAVWDIKERERLLTGATVVKVTWDALVLQKDGRRIVVEADCFACGFGRFIVTVRE